MMEAGLQSLHFARVQLLHSMAALTEVTGNEKAISITRQCIEEAIRELDKVIELMASKESY